MRNGRLWLYAATALTLVGVSCKNSSKSDLMIPKDAAIVIHINSASLSSKLSWKEIQQAEWFKEINKESTDSMAKQLLADPATSGVDTKQDLVYFMKKQGKGGYMVFEGSVADASKFEKLNKETNKNAEVKKDGDLTQMQLENNAVVTWKGNKFIYIFDAPFLSMASSYTTNDGEGSNAFPADSLKKFAKDIFALKGDNNLPNDDRFADMIAETGDVHLWMNSSNLYKGVVGGALSMMKVSSLLEGNVSATTLNFDNGKISFNATQYYGTEVKKLLDKYEFKNVSADLINRIPTQDVIGAFAMNCPPELLKEIFVLAGIDGLVNAGLAQMNYSMDELVQATKGELLLAVSDLKVKEKEMFPGTAYAYKTKDPDMKFLMAASVNNQAAFEKLVGIVKKQPHDTTKTSVIDYKIENKWFAVSNEPGYTSKFLAGGNNKLAFTDKIAGHPFVAFLDIQKILKSTESNMTTELEKGSMTASIRLWQDVVMYGGEYKKGKMTYHVDINLVDKNTNSLKQLNSYGGQIYTLNKQQKKAQIEANEMYPESSDVITDSTYSVEAPSKY
ncbi:DUF4836 family protein [Flavisolibacter tropicus]|nr:DUF4836 family protein [Flavisolibacter tropicus]